MLVKCKECGKEYDLGFFSKLKNYECSECGGELRTPTFQETSEKIKGTPKAKEDSNSIPKTPNKKGIFGFGIKVIVLILIGVVSFAWLFIFFPVGIIGFIFFFGLLFDEMRTKTEKNITYCPDCNHKVSKMAETCPKCGHPFK